MENSANGRLSPSHLDIHGSMRAPDGIAKSASPSASTIRPLEIPSKKHFAELDALRGIAALAVVFHHYGLLQNHRSYVKFLLHVLFNGHSAVILFFALSGFVLALPQARGGRQLYNSFLVRRICRIYLPYLGALLLALLGDAFIHNRVALSPFFNNTWSVPITFRLVLSHILFIGDYNYTQVNAPFWSLVHEMRISLLFPLFCWGLYRLRIKTALVVLAGSSIAATLLAFAFPSVEREFATLHYVAIFGLGAMLALHVSEVSDWYCAQNLAIKLGLFVFAAFLFVSRTEALAERTGFLADVPVALGAILLITLSLASARLKAILNHRIPMFFGRISYSLYLVHATVLFTLINLLHARLSPEFMFAVYLVSTLGLSWTFWKFVEAPSARLGRRLCTALDARATRTGALSGETRLANELTRPGAEKELTIAKI